MLEILLTMIVTILIVGFVVGITPYIVRRNIHFGVMLPDVANEMDITKKWKKQFFTSSVGLSIIGILLIMGGFLLNLDEETMMNFVIVAGVAVVGIISTFQFVLYFYFRSKAKALKAEKFGQQEFQHDARIMVSTGFRNEKITVSNTWILLLGMGIILATILLPILVYDQIPAYVPVNWGSEGAVRFVEKTPRIFIPIPAIQSGMLLIFLFVNYSVKATKQIISPRNAKQSLRQNRAFRYALSKFLLLVGIASMLMLSTVQIMMSFAIEDSVLMGWVSIAFAIFTLISVLYLVLKYGQGGERYKQVESSDDKNQPYQMVDDDQFWKLGMIYYNPNDTAVFVEKRFGIGMTVNFAKWQAWAMLAGILVFTVATIIISFVMTG